MAEKFSTSDPEQRADGGNRLGDLLVRDGLIAPESIQRVLELQKASGAAAGKHQLFGQLCVQNKLLTQDQLQVFLKKHGKSIKLGELLLKQQAITPQALEQALAQQKKKTDQRLGEILLEQKSLSEDVLVAALGQQWGMPVLRLILNEIDFSLLDGLDLKFVHDSGFLPVSQTDKEITVVMFSPNDMNVLNYLEGHYNKKIRRTIGPLTAVRAALKEYYLRRKSELAKPKPAPVAPPAPAPAQPPTPPAPPKAGASDSTERFDGQGLGALFKRFEEPYAEKTPDKKDEAVSELAGLSLGAHDDDEPSLTGRSLGGGAHEEDEPSLVGLSLGVGDEDEEPSLTGLSLGGFDDEEDDSPALSASLTKLFEGKGDDQPKSRTSAKAAGKGKAAEAERVKPAEPEVPAEPPAPLIVEDSLIVGGVSLSSGKSQFQQQEGMLNYLIKNALIDHASAIHLEPQGMFIRVRYRIDGVLNQKTALPATLGNPMVARLKQICSLNPENTTLPQRNRVQASFNDQGLELGIATYPGAHGETMVLNLRQKQVAQQAPFLNLEHAGFSPLNLWRFKLALSRPGGLVVVTGPARSGKTSTVYAAINHLNLLTKSISTAESPIELTVPGINQGNWTPESGLSFAEMIRSMSFLDSDSLMVSELDSPETIEASVELALAGAKVVTTYPSFDSMGALLRLKTQGLEPFLIASGNLTLVSQRLVRKLCPACRQQEPAHKELLKLLGMAEITADEQVVWVARGCPECQQVGYAGQTVLHEVLLINEAMREALLNQLPAAKIRALARNEGRLVSMAEDGYYKAVEGITSLAEVQRVASINEYDSQSPRSAKDLLAMCRSGGQD